jgi:hypothetical protein
MDTAGFPTVPYKGWSVNIHPMRSVALALAMISMEAQGD